MATAEATEDQVDGVDRTQEVDEACDEMLAAEQEACGEPSEEPTAYTKAEQRHYAEILEQNKRVSVAEGDYEDANADAKRLKKVFEGETTKLRSLIRGGPTDAQPMLPGIDGDDATPSNAWREFSLAEAGIDGGLAKAILAEEMETLGQVADWLAAGSSITDIRGIGLAAGEKYEDLMTAFWAEHPEFCEAEDAEDGGDEADNKEGDEAAEEEE